MALVEIHYKGWRIEVLHHGVEDWKALIYRPSSLLHEESVPTGSNRHAVMGEAKTIVDRCLEQ